MNPLSCFVGSETRAPAVPCHWDGPSLRTSRIGARPVSLRAAGVQPDARVEEAVAVVLARRQGDGRWLLDLRHRNTLHGESAGTVGASNRWITLRALRVLDWSARQD